MEVILSKKPRGVTVLEGFPGFGLVGTIVTEYLLDNLEMEKIGSVRMQNIPAMVAIHQSQVVEPVSIHYSKKYNLVVVHALTPGNKLGWDMGKMVAELARMLQAKEILSIEGVGSTSLVQNSQVFYYTTVNGARKERLSKVAEPLTEGVVIGVTGALLLTPTRTPITALFAEVHSRLPDAKAAASVIKALDGYVGLEIDPGPLVKQAEELEGKLKGILSQTKIAGDQQKRKELSYVG